MCLCEREGGSNDVINSDELALLDLSCDILAFLLKKKILVVFRPFFLLLLQRTNQTSSGSCKVQ